ncbi:hypothetical protein [Vallicoccus soli]|uniref:hypothetical protein n=1 Tax=Vallicoccus soli TaxID=2339232 RepID=UPI00105A8C1D|nr:hypothetical protein [Vallicoccus soli]
MRDTRLPWGLGDRLDSRLGWRLRRYASPLQPLGWLAAGVPPSRIGYGPGPLTAARRRRHARAAAGKPVRLCLLEGPVRGTRFSPVTAFWVNERSRLVHAVVDEPEGADVLWVHTQDPVAPEVRPALERMLARARPGAPVLNPLGAYDAYHRAGTFARLRDAGVSVPDPEPRAGDLVVVKGPGQTSAKELVPYRPPLAPGHRAFAYVDARGPDGLHRRYRTFHLLGTVHPGDVVSSSAWEVGLGTLEGHEPTYVMTDEEEEQVRRVGEVLGLDWFCVDHVRRAGDGRPFVTDVNVYPTAVVGERVDAQLGARGRWHFLDTAERMGVPEQHGSFWPRFDEAFARLLGLDPAPTGTAGATA